MVDPLLLNECIHYFNASLSKEFKVSYQCQYTIQSGFFNACFELGDYKVRKKQLMKEINLEEKMLPVYYILTNILLPIYYRLTKVGS